MIPADHTVTFALTTYGQWLVHRHELAMRLQASLFPAHPVWNDQAFVLQPLKRSSSSGIDITSARLEHPTAIRLLDRAIAIKALATLLRFAYLADAPLRRVTWVPPPAHAGGRTSRLQAAFVDSHGMELLVAEDPDADGHLRMVQSGDPARWFHTDLWTAPPPMWRPHSAAHTSTQHRIPGPRPFAALMRPLRLPSLRAAPPSPPRLGVGRFS